MRQKITVLMLFVFVLASLPIFAQLQPPTGLTATEGSTWHDKYVKLEWTYSTPTPTPNVHFKVFKKENDSSGFHSVASNLKDKRYFDYRVHMGQTISYYVVAYTSNTNSAVSDTVQITISNTPPVPQIAVIKGTVTDANGVALKDAFVKAFAQNWWFIKSAKSKTDGSFSMTVNPGSYYIFTAKTGYYSEYYDNVLTYQEATLQTLAAGDTLTISISLATYVPPATFTLTGNVTNDQNLPQRATIYVYKVRANNYHYLVKKTHTDSLGNYSIPVKENDTVIVYAAAQGFTYYPEFYNNKRVIADADRIPISGNVTDINFVMDPLATFANGLSGSVADTNGAPVMGYVSAYRVEGTLFGKNHYAVHTDSLGAYSFANLVPGEYILFLKPEGNFKPTYFKYDMTPAFRRKDADSIVVDSTSMISGLNFLAVPRADSGWASISGKVTGTTGNAIGGSFVYALDQNNQVVAFAMADANGSFVIDGMMPGDYTVVPDRADYMNAVTATANIDIYTSTNPFVSVKLENDNPSGTDNGTSVITDYQLSQNFPNPFNPSTTIRYSIPEAGVVTLKIFNILGKEVGTLVNGFQQAGSFNVTFDASNLPSGVYLYQIEAGSFRATKKLTLLK
jgi:protocatechuate 3,4-dioxygenase beta subunit